MHIELFTRWRFSCLVHFVDEKNWDFVQICRRELETRVKKKEKEGTQSGEQGARRVVTF